MHSTANVQIPNSQTTASSFTNTPTLLSSVNIYEKFPFLSQQKYEKYRDFYYKNMDVHGRLSNEIVYNLFSYLNLPSTILDLVWSLCDVHSTGLLNLPEFLLFIYFLNLYLSCYELPVKLPLSLRRELKLAEDRQLEEMNKNHSTSNFLGNSRRSNQLWNKEHGHSAASITTVVNSPEKSIVWLPPNKEPPDSAQADDTQSNDPHESSQHQSRHIQPSTSTSTSTHPHIHIHPNLIELKQKIAKQQEVLHSLTTYSKEQQEMEEIEQLKAKIKVIQNEINSVEESQPDMDFSKVIPLMISSSEQRHQLEMEFDGLFSELESLTSKARELNEKLAIARLSLFRVKDFNQFGTSVPEMDASHEMVDEQARLKHKAAEMFAQRMQALTITLSTNDPASVEAQVRFDAEKARIEKEKRRSDKDIEQIERKAHRMNSRLGRAEQFIHLYSEILMANQVSDLDSFMEELKSTQTRPCITDKSRSKSSSSVISNLCECTSSVLPKSPVSFEERQKKMMEEAHKRLIERERYLTEDLTRLKEEKEDAHNRIRRQEIEWKSIRHQALAQAQTTIANARAEMQAAREETAAKANRNNRARLAEETQVIEMLAQEKIEAADRESHAIERLAKEKIDAACREREELENKFRERMHQVEIAIKNTELEKNEIMNICEGKHQICNSHTPPPIPPPPLPASLSPSLLGTRSSWLNRKLSSPTDFPRTSISSIQKASTLSESYSFVSQPLVPKNEEVSPNSPSEQPACEPTDPLRLPFSVEALYSYTAPGKEYLGFEKGTIILVDPEFKSDEWWFGKLEDGQEGWFPKSYVYTEKLPSQAPFLARVLYDYEGTCNDELFVKADSVVDILEKTDANWWKAQYQGNIGMIPARYVQQLMVLTY